MSRLRPGQARLAVAAAIAFCFALVSTSALAAEPPEAGYVKACLGHLLKSEYDQGLADCDEAIRLNPESGSAYNLRGVAYRAKGDDASAIADFDRAIELGLNDAEPLRNRGMTRFARGEVALALADYDAAVRRFPQDWLSRFSRGVAEIYDSAPAKAEADFAAAASLEPSDPTVAVWLQMANQRTGSRSQLAAAARRFDLTSWTAQFVRMFLGEISAAGLLAAARSDAANHPIKVCEAEFYAGEFLQQRRKKVEAIGLYQQAARDCPPIIIEGVAARAALRSLGVTK